jgi:hypothetical protein
MTWLKLNAVRVVRGVVLRIEAASASIVALLPARSQDAARNSSDKQTNNIAMITRDEKPLASDGENDLWA